ncbi:hypothetical protein [Virgibacillus siamensis]|uniref:hypothetical protein n=1 Tax=Virgibacillus siamensis TaxID=480071 RepID=UPI000985FE56|nr:hypothetical protein [Virgibacillus siamensis]
MTRKLTPYELMAMGYDKTEKETLEDGGQEAEVIKKDNKEERPLSAIEMLMAGYNPDSTQKEKEVTVNPNEIEKEGDK